VGDRQLPDATKPYASQPRLAVGCYRLCFAAETALHFSDFPGSAWRGALGHALVRVACTHSGRTCPPCRRPAACAYGYLFETAPPEGAAKMRLYEQVPHPFALRLEEVAEQTGRSGRMRGRRSASVRKQR
jgi:hypothetical protein